MISTFILHWPLTIFSFKTGFRLGRGIALKYAEYLRLVTDLLRVIYDDLKRQNHRMLRITYNVQI
jgi:hypothetical protein